MTMTRKTFVHSLAGSTVTLWLQGCGGGGGYSAPAPAPAPAPSGAPTCGATANDITANHGHTLTIPKADLDATTDKSYNLGPSVEGHLHSISFSVAQLAVMKGGGTVTVTASTTAVAAIYGGTHNHNVTASVAATCT